MPQDYWVYFDEFASLPILLERAQRPVGPPQSSLAPEERHRPADAHVAVVEVAEASEGDGGQQQKAGLGQLHLGFAVNVVGQHLPQAPAVGVGGGRSRASRTATKQEDKQLFSSHPPSKWSI